MPSKMGSKLVGKYINKKYVCFLEFTFQEITLQTFMCLFIIRKVGQRKTFSS
jgi:hypothetical protein